MAEQTTHIFGIRHHGPGSARSLRDALMHLQPDCVLVEGPPEADALLPLVTNPEMHPPVAIVVYSPENPSRAVFYPFAIFSPEWQAITFALQNGVPVRFFDLPQTNWMASKRLRFSQDETNSDPNSESVSANSELDTNSSSVPSNTASDTNSTSVPFNAASDTNSSSVPPNTDSDTDSTSVPSNTASDTNSTCVPSNTASDTNSTSVPSNTASGTNSTSVPSNTPSDTNSDTTPQAATPDTSAQDNPGGQTTQDDETDSVPPVPTVPTVRQDPLMWLAQAAGYSDGERWWEHLVEQRQNSEDLFIAINEAMASLREELADELDAEDERLDNLREAHMRQMIRAAEKQGFKRIAVVCGAWHGPALSNMPSAKSDAALLKGLPKLKVEATWIPWTHGRLSYSTGYGAGINSPGWYHHLWSHTNMISERWLSHVARLLRAEDLDASSASVIEAARLAETLASMRNRPVPGLTELTEATKAVLCSGNEVPMRLIHQKLIVGEVLGAVPQETPTVPLHKDLQAEQKRLRMPADASEKIYDLDLRKETDVKRSRLLHRLTILEIPWGKEEAVSGKSGTFHEVWRVLWKPEFSLDLIERGIWGRTMQEAATAFACDHASKAELPELTRLLAQALLADLRTATEFIMVRVENQAAVASDLRQLMNALPPLARIARYGDVRKTDVGAVAHVTGGMVARICIGLPGACASLNDDAAQEMFEHIQNVHGAITLLQNDSFTEDWKAALRNIANSDVIHGLISGRACRILLELRDFEPDEAARRFSLALSRAVDPNSAAAWSEGFLKGSGLLLVHNESLWQVVDGWLQSLDDSIFNVILPLMRRTFSTFTKPERRQMGERAAASRARSKRAGTVETSNVNPERAARVLPLALRILGLESVSGAPSEAQNPILSETINTAEQAEDE